jgi:hypothetical protein
MICFCCPAGCRQTRSKAKEDIDIHLLKPAWFAVDPLYSIPPTMSANIVQELQGDRMDPGEEYLTYEYRTAHPVLRWLPTKLAEWIGANLCEELNILDKQGPLWTAAKLNTIITGNLVGGPYGHLRTFGCIQWENELFSSRPKARCYSFNIQVISRPLFSEQESTGRCVISYPISLPLACCICIYRTRYRIRYCIRYRLRYYKFYDAACAGLRLCCCPLSIQD